MAGTGTWFGCAALTVPMMLLVCWVGSMLIPTWEPDVSRAAVGQTYEENVRIVQVRTESVRRGLELPRIFEERCGKCEQQRLGYLYAVDNRVPSNMCDAARGRAFQRGCRIGSAASDYQ